jgi:hypothetical protein
VTSVSNISWLQCNDIHKRLVYFFLRSKWLCAS